MFTIIDHTFIKIYITYSRHFNVICKHKKTNKRSEIKIFASARLLGIFPLQKYPCM